jgi:hypothetical protein
MEAVFSTRSVPRCYEQGQLAIELVSITNSTYQLRAGVHLRKKNSGRESQGARRQDELIGGKPPVVK